MAMWKHEAQVTGNLEFPLDMLRYDCCFPDQGDDVGAIQRTMRLHSRSHEAVTVTVIRYTDGKTGEPFTRARWDSFGWTVSDVSSRKL